MVAKPKPKTAEIRIHPDEVFIVSCNNPIVLFSKTIKMTWTDWLAHQRSRMLTGGGKDSETVKQHKKIEKTKKSGVKKQSRLMSEYMNETRDNMRHLAIESSILKSLGTGDNKYIRKYNEVTKDLYEIISKDTEILQTIHEQEVHRLNEMEAALQEVAEKKEEVESIMENLQQTTDSTEKGNMLSRIYELEISKRKSFQSFKDARTRIITDIYIDSADNTHPNLPKGGSCVCTSENTNSEIDELFCFCV